MEFLPVGSKKIIESYYSGRSVNVAETLDPDCIVQEFFCYGIIMEGEEQRYLLQPLEGLYAPQISPTHIHMWPTDKQKYPECWSEREQQIYENVLRFKLAKD